MMSDFSGSIFDKFERLKAKLPNTTKVGFHYEQENPSKQISIRTPHMTNKYKSGYENEENERVRLWKRHKEEREKEGEYEENLKMGQQDTRRIDENAALARKKSG